MWFLVKLNRKQKWLDAEGVTAVFSAHAQVVWDASFPKFQPKVWFCGEAPEKEHQLLHLLDGNEFIRIVSIDVSGVQVQYFSQAFKLKSIQQFPCIVCSLKWL